MATENRTLKVGIDTSGVKEGVDSLEELVEAARKADVAIDDLSETARETSNAVAETAEAAKTAAEEMTAISETARTAAEAEEKARERLREVVRASLEKQQAMRAEAAAVQQAAKATRDLAAAQSPGSVSLLSQSYAAARQELEAFADAMSHEAQSLDDIAERREWLAELVQRHLIDEKEQAAHLETLTKQERSLKKAIDEHADAARRLLNVYDPASAALQKLAEDEKRLEEALQSGYITAEQHAKALDGLKVSRAEWEAEAQGIRKVASELNLMALASSGAFRDYATFISALGRGDMMLASNQLLQLGVRTNALRSALSLLVNPASVLVGVMGAYAYAAHQAQKQNFELNKALISTGGVAGVTAGQIAVIAKEVDEFAGTQNAAVKALQMLSTTGRVGAENLKEFTIAAIEMKSAAGQSIEDTAKHFADLRREPLVASERLSQSMHYLTEEMRAQIIEAQRLGDIERAGALAQQFYAQTMLDRARRIKQELPTLSAAAKQTGSFFAEMWDAISGGVRRISGSESIEEELARLRETRGSRPLFSAVGERYFRDQREVELQRQVDEAARRAQQERDRVLEVERKERERIEIRARLQSERVIEDATAGARRARIQRELDNTLAQLNAYEAQLEAERQAARVDEETYYSERRKLIEQHTAAQIEALEAENAELARSNAIIRARALAEKDLATTKEEADRIQSAADAQLIANQSQILDNESEIARLRGREIADLRALEIAREAASDALTRYYVQAQAAAQSYLDVLRQQRERELEAMTMGTRARERAARFNEIEDRFQQQRQQLESDWRTGPQNDIARQKYEHDLRVLEETRAAALRVEEDFWKKRTELESSFYSGAQSALQDYIDSAANVAQQSYDAFTNAFQGMENALVQFAMTGKATFKELAQSIIADILRIQVRAATSQLFGNLLGMLGPAQPIASSATASMPVAMARVAHTGEMRVPTHNSLYVLAKDEAVLPARYNPWAGGRLPFGSGPSVTINQTITPTPGMNMAELRLMMEQVKQETIAEVAENLSRKRWDGVLT